ncbi:hypothetical protein [Priestia flexa]|uniref:hypothetical protein n=1 Tax=Priestia flexa TaxID=86664 RepID=UPI000A76166A|nr:hypothetical protein [Priestia flexa]MED4588619.1 hypothetical protein [Priestia flexa]
MRSINKSSYSRTAGTRIKTLAFENEKTYIEWLKREDFKMIHDVDNEDGLIIVQYTE